MTTLDKANLILKDIFGISNLRWAKSYPARIHGTSVNTNYVAWLIPNRVQFFLRVLNQTHPEFGFSLTISIHEKPPSDRDSWGKIAFDCVLHQENLTSEIVQTGLSVIHTYIHKELAKDD